MSASTIKVAIADDHTLFREGIELIIESVPEFELVLTVPDGQALLDGMVNLPVRPDVVLLDLKMPKKDGMKTTPELRAAYPEIKILILTMFDQEDYILHMLDVGANGYLLKNSSTQDVKTAIKSLAEKEFYFTDQISKVVVAGLRKKRKLPPAFNAGEKLTPREEEVLSLICSENTTQEIADKLFVSVRTIETHRKHLMEKLGATNTAGIIYRAMKQGLLS